MFLVLGSVGFLKVLVLNAEVYMCEWAEVNVYEGKYTGKPSFWAALSSPHLPLHIPQPFPLCSCEFLDLASHKTDQHLLKCVYKHIYFIYFNISIFMGFTKRNYFFLPSMKT